MVSRHVTEDMARCAARVAGFVYFTAFISSPPFFMIEFFLPFILGHKRGIFLLYDLFVNVIILLYTTELVVLYRYHLYI